MKPIEVRKYINGLKLELADKVHALTPKEKAGIENEIATWEYILIAHRVIK